ncbi:phage tail sheath family protein [Paenibacillus sp. FSL R5-0766]|uniref:phage tail sheath family protein n=1 Tax=unclassified Paenibacillus TaxID=185978 RepID=UPI00096EB506|nr:phage tail sheath family protein [Paenibacillus sp. FSL R5-0765]OMF66300.1 phage tail sheath protein [Paenibacillus sp. FSL R5-0765]
MAGGTWTTQNKVRPGVYMNFASEGSLPGTVGERGTVALALPLSWGQAGTILTVQAGEDVQAKLGYDWTAPQLLLIREALKRAQTLLLYRLNAGTKAKATLDNLIVTAQHGGVRGNDLAVVISANINDPEQLDVSTLLAGKEVDKQTASTIEALESNAYVTFTGEGALTATASLPLTGGLDGTATNQEHADFLTKLEVLDFNTVGLISDDATLKSVYTAYIKRLRDTEGKKVQLVLSDYPAADHEGIISVKNGVVLADGTVLTPKQTVAWTAGATAGANLNESLTFRAYDDAVDVSGRLTHSETEAALRNGEFVFTASSNRAVVEQDVNTFRSVTPDKARHFAKNRVVRVLDGIANDMKRIFESYYIGKVNNNEDGRSLFRSQCVTYLKQLQDIGAIQNFDSKTDITVAPGNETDSILIEIQVQPVDSVEKVYMKVKVV